MIGSRGLPWLLAFCLTALAAAPSASLPKPSWTVGDSWTYETNQTLLPGLGLSGSVTWTVQSRIPGGGDPTVPAGAYYIVFAGSGSAGGVVATMSGPVPIQGTWLLTGEELVEPATFQLLSNIYDLAVNGSAGGFVDYAVRVQNTTTFDITSTTSAYPIQAGTRWSTNVLYNYTQDLSITGPVSRTNHSVGNGEWVENFSASAPVEVSTPLGTFQTLPITETWPDGSRDVAYGSGQTGNAVRTESYDAAGNRTAVTTLTAYRYQALEASTFLGLTALEWSILAAVLGGAAVVVVVVRRARRKKAPPPTGPSGPDLTSGPRGP